MKKNIIKRKNKIIIEAIDLLDELGIQGLTTKEIAKRRDPSEPAIYSGSIEKSEAKSSFNLG
jgi:AcrR family transcriptional regulator